MATVGPSHAGAGIIRVGGTDLLLAVLETALGIGHRRGNWELTAGYEMSLWGNMGKRRDFVSHVDDDKTGFPGSDLLLDSFFFQVAYNH
jgi:hypothetical protein